MPADAENARIAMTSFVASTRRENLEEYFGSIAAHPRATHSMPTRSAAAPMVPLFDDYWVHARALGDESDHGPDRAGPEDQQLPGKVSSCSRINLIASSATATTSWMTCALAEFAGHPHEIVLLNDQPAAERADAIEPRLVA